MAYSAHGPLGHAFRGYGSFAGRVAPTFSSVRYSSHGPLGHSFRGYGSFVRGAENAYTVGNSPIVAYTVYAPTWLPDNMHVLAFGMQITEESFDPLGYWIETPFVVGAIVDITYQTFAPVYTITGVTDNFYSVTGGSPVVYEVLHPYDASDRSFIVGNIELITYQVINPMYSPAVYGDVLLSLESINAISEAIVPVLREELPSDILDTPVLGTITLKKSQRALLATTLGDDIRTQRNLTPGAVTGYTDPLDKNRTRVTATIDENNARVVTAIDLED